MAIYHVMNRFNKFPKLHPIKISIIMRTKNCCPSAEKIVFFYFLIISCLHFCISDDQFCRYPSSCQTKLPHVFLSDKNSACLPVRLNFPLSSCQTKILYVCLCDDQTPCMFVWSSYFISFWLSDDQPAWSSVFTMIRLLLDLYVCP